VIAKNISTSNFATLENLSNEPGMTMIIRNGIKMIVQVVKTYIRMISDHEKTIEFYREIIQKLGEGMILTEGDI
jgi:uncharacterized protein YutE (UPF0331/DUF86 family)